MATQNVHFVSYLAVSELDFSIHTGVLEIIASFYAPPLESTHDPLQLSREYKKALEIASFCELLLIDTNSQNLQKLQFYRHELDQEKNNLRASKNRALNPSTLYTQAHA